LVLLEPIFMRRSKTVESIYETVSVPADLKGLGAPVIKPANFVALG
jgi:hypothetical protein